VTLLVLILRVAVGVLFVWAGSAKIGHADVFAAQIAAFGLVPQAAIAPMALLLPFAEVLLGAYLLLGLYTRVAALIAVVQLAIFATAIGSAVGAGYRCRAAASGRATKRLRPGPRSCATWSSRRSPPSLLGEPLGCSPLTAESEM